MKNLLTEIKVPKKIHRIDLPIPVSKDKDAKLFLLWSLEDGKLYINVKQDGVDDSYFEGILSAEESKSPFALDIAFPDPIPHLKTENSSLELGFADNSKIPNSLTFRGDIILGKKFSHSFKDLEYAFNW